MEATVGGQTLILHCDRAAYWKEDETLIVADVHLGKAAAFRALHVPVPEGTTRANLCRLSALIELFVPKRLVILGDLWHARDGRTEEALQNLATWRKSELLEVILVEGNHDRKAGPLPDYCQIPTESEPYIQGPFALRHYPEPTDGAYTLAGHIHPAAVLEGRGRQVLRVPCFWFGAQVGVLPAFGEFTGCAPVLPSANDQVIAVADGRLFPIPTGRVAHAS